MRFHQADYINFLEKVQPGPARGQGTGPQVAIINSPFGRLLFLFWVLHTKYHIIYHLVERRMRQGGLILAADRVRSKEKTRIEKKTTTSRRTRNTPRHPQQPVNRDHHETACEETRPTR